jgi:hypothetical protein
VSDTVIIVNAVLAFFGTAFTGIMAYLLTRLNQKQAIAAERAEVAVTKVAEVAVKAQEVKKTLSESTEAITGKLDGIAKVGEATHILVNNNMAIQLRISAAALRRIARSPEASPDDQTAAQLAEEALAEHLRKQKELDAKEGRLP